MRELSIILISYVHPFELRLHLYVSMQVTDVIAAEDVTQSFWELCQSAALIMKELFWLYYLKLIFPGGEEGNL